MNTNSKAAPRKSTGWKSAVVWSLKIGIPLAIIGFLLLSIDEQQLAQLRAREKQWGMLTAAFALSLAAVLITFVRWHLLVRALEMPFRMRDAFRLGFLGFLLNFVSVGIVGGDLFKAVFIAREQPGRRAEAVATVVVDRLVGLYALFLVTTAAILIGGMPGDSAEIVTICRATYVATAVGGIFILMLFVPGFTNGSVSEMLTRLPKIGGTIHKLIGAVRMYRTKPGILTVIVVMSMVTHGMFAMSLFLIASSLFDNVPTLQEHLIIIPLAMVVGALPITPGGLGTFEASMDALYYWTTSGQTDAVGVLIALCYRVVTIAIAVIGAVVYWTSRSEVREVLHEAEVQAAAEVSTAN